MDASERVRIILRDLLEAAEKAVDKIHAIGEQERQRIGKETPEGQAWDAFAGMGMGVFSDAGRAVRNIQAEIAAVRGQMIYRGLDSSRKQISEQGKADE